MARPFSPLAPLALLACAAALAATSFVEGTRVLYTLTAGDQFDNRFTALPDLDGDGVGDLALGDLTFGPPAQGGLALHSGATGEKIRQLVPVGSETTFPNLVADAGDVNGDGVHDVAVCTCGGAFDNNRGAVRFYSGADGQLLRTLTGNAGNERFGSALASPGDVDGDAVPDLAIGAPRANGSRGRVYLHSGATGALIRTFDAPDSARSFGTDIDAIRDVDGDRRNDLVVGAPAIDFPNTKIVQVYSSSGGPATATVSGPGDSPSFGANVGSAGDFNGDGVADFFVADSAAGGTVQAGGPGRYQVFSSAGGGLLYQVSGVAAGDQVGRTGGTYDFDHDGRTDLLVGARSGAAANAGSLVIRAGPDGHALQTITGTTIDERFGDRSAPVGDVDGDGRVDLIATTFGAAASYFYLLAGSVAEGGPLVPPGPQHSGLWFEQSHSGEGFVLEMLGNGVALAYFFTYTADGAQRYFVGVGSIVGPRIVIRDFVDTAGGRLGGAFDPANVVRRDRSQLVLSFDGCNSGWAEYTVDGVRGRQRLSRLTALAGATCQAAGNANPDYSGTWYDAAHSGEGWVVQSISATQYVLLWFSYDDTGHQQWFISIMDRTGATIATQGLLRPAGGRFGPYFDPTEVSRPAVGALQLVFSGCANAAVSWNVPGSNAASNLTRLTRPDGIACD
jgi:hypothetical protein